jgi:hypothetical protein
MAIFNSYVKLPEGNHCQNMWSSVTWIQTSRRDRLVGTDACTGPQFAVAFCLIHSWSRKVSPWKTWPKSPLIPELVEGSEGSLCTLNFGVELAVSFFTCSALRILLYLVPCRLRLGRYPSRGVSLYCQNLRLQDIYTALGGPVAGLLERNRLQRHGLLWVWKLGDIHDSWTNGYLS